MRVSGAGAPEASLNRTLSDLKQMLTLGALTARHADWRIPVIGLSAYKGEGFETLIAAEARHACAGDAVVAGAVDGQRREGGTLHLRIPTEAGH